MADIKISRVGKRFGAVEVLRGIDLEIADREFVALVGPSGCGKSTLLRIIAGLEEHDEGNIEIEGRLVNELPPRDRDVAMVFQSYALYPHMNVYKNMAFTLRMRGESKAEIDRKVRTAAEALNLTEYLDRSPAQLSGGQRQRVAMGRALVRKPKVFLFDEPLSNLDAKLRVEMRTEIRRLHQDIKATSIYVTHDQVEAMTMADRIVVLNRGELVQQGSPMELYDNPASVFVAEFIGTPRMNIFPGRLVSNGKGSEIIAGADARIKVPASTKAREQHILWGIRPDDLSLCEPDKADFSGRVAVVENTGGETLVFLKTAIGEICVKAPPRSLAKIDDVVGIEAHAGRLHFFDQATKARLVVSPTESSGA